MRKLPKSLQRVGLFPLLLVPLLAFALACGTAAAPTPTATKAAPVATPTAPVAVPTATKVPTPTPTATPIGGVPQRGGTLVQYMSYPTHWDQTQQSTPSGNPLGNMYLTLVNEVGRDGKFECDICTKWSLEDGGKTMVFSLRDNIKFGDGKPITSKDLKYSLEKLEGKVDGVVNARMGFVKEYITSLETPDDRTFIIRLNHPSTVVPQALAIVYAAILPDGTKRAELSEPPVGPNNKYISGPFYLKQAVPDSNLTFERNPNYFKNGLPYLDTLQGQVFADTAAATTAFLVGKVDLYVAIDSPPAQFAPQLRKMEKAGQVGSVDTPQWCIPGNLYLNLNDPLMKEPKLRHAINLAIDRVEYGNVRYFGDYVAAAHYPAGTQWGRSEKDIWDVMEGYGTGANKAAEKAKAKELLTQAGFPAGISQFELMGAATDFTFGGTEVIQRNLKAVGVNAAIINPTDYAQRWAAGKFTVLNYRSCMAIDDPDELVAGYFLKGGARNLQGYVNQEVERLYPLMSAETDPIKRRQLFIQIEDMVYQDLPIITFVDGNRVYWYYIKVHGFNPGRTIYGVATNRGENLWVK